MPPRKRGATAPVPPLVSALAAEIERRRGLHGFVRAFWRFADPASTFVDGWAIGAICEALEAVSKREIKRLVINIPPGMSKSSIVSVHWPAWHWIRDPKHKWIVASNDYTLVLRDAEKMLRVLQSAVYQQAFPKCTLGETPAVGLFTNQQGGLRFSTSIGGRGVGWHADTQIVDDPHKPKDSRNQAALDKAIDWWQNTMSTRRTNAETFARVVVMQRIAEKDLSAVCRDDGYDLLCLPMHWTPKFWSDLSSRLDRRTQPDELLFPERFPASAVEDLAKSLGTPMNVSAQLEQDPIPDKGGIIERDWIRAWGDVLNGAHVRLPRQMQCVQSWDFNAKGSDDSHSRVVGELWGYAADCYYLLDEVRGLWNYPTAKRQFILAQSRPGWAEAPVKLIEEKANGIAIIDELEAGTVIDGQHVAVRGIVRVNPKDDKTTRLIAHSDVFEAGLVFVPLDAPWVEDWKAELCAHPRGAHDDRVDVTTQALDRLRARHTRYTQTLKRIQK